MKCGSYEVSFYTLGAENSVNSKAVGLNKKRYSLYSSVKQEAEGGIVPSVSEGPRGRRFRRLKSVVIEIQNSSMQSKHCTLKLKRRR